MKHLPPMFLAPVLAFSLPALRLHAQAPAGGDPFVKGSPASGAPAKADEPDLRNCLVVLEVYSLEKSDAYTVLDSERGSAARLRRVTDLVNAGHARLEILTGLTTKPGQRASSESTEDVRYPTSFNPPQHKDGDANPIGMTTRKVGDNFEVEPVLDKGRSCDLNLSPTHTHLAGFRDIAAMPGDTVVFQPIFNSQRMAACAFVIDGEPRYLGTFSPPTAHGMANGGAASPVWLAFVRVNVLKAIGEPAKPPTKPVDWTNVHVEYTCFSLDRKLAREVLTGATSIDAPWEKVQALLGEKKARFEHIVTVNTRSGQRCTSDESQELRYAANYNPAQFSGTAQDNHRTITTGPVPENPEEPGKKEIGKGATISQTAEAFRTETYANRIPGMAGEIEERNLGVSVEVEPVVNADGVTVDLNHVLQSFAYSGDLKATGAGERYPAQPIFQTRKFVTSQLIPASHRVLVGTLNPPSSDGLNAASDADRAWLVFVRATPNEP